MSSCFETGLSVIHSSSDGFKSIKQRKRLKNYFSLYYNFNVMAGFWVPTQLPPQLLISDK